MKTIGVIGGMSWESTAEYYQEMNRQVKERLGGLHSAECMIYSVDFAEIERYQAEGEWDKAGQVLAEAGKKLELAGADVIVLATNTMHKVIDQIDKAIEVPTIHIADATADAIKAQGLNRVALLGTKYTMEQEFYKGRIAEQNLEVLVPNETDQNRVHRIIFDELVLGEFHDHSREYYIDVINRLVQQGAEGVIFGCTEIGLLIKSHDVTVPVFDTSQIHVTRAVDYALEN
ncbi:aspartate/glutamate racemase family protein [Alkalibacillus sp. S2W]|uniref:aspartate/glutamate racemase family protein n=1 Tax=Alkalibacillus sp. S2W TaxID=3386553 RepID=UPI00398CF86F